MKRAAPPPSPSRPCPGTRRAATGCLLLLLAVSAASCGGSSPSTGAPASGTATGWLSDQDALEYLPADRAFFKPNGSLNVPASVDLSAYFPPVGNQGSSGTCVAWAAGYYQRTALDAVRGGLAPADLQDAARQFSPNDLFLSIPDAGKSGCTGTRFEAAYNVLRDRGIVTNDLVPSGSLLTCGYRDDPQLDAVARANRIQRYDKIPTDKDTLKTFLNARWPVVVGLQPNSRFLQWRGNGVYSAADYSSPAGGHAMAVTGYDDRMGPNGAFRLVNSYGPSWGDHGSIWVDQDLLSGNATFCAAAFIAKTGYPNPDYFSVAFRRMTGMTPEQYRVVER